MRPALLSVCLLSLALGVTVCVGELSRLQEQFAWKQMTYVARNARDNMAMSSDFAFPSASADRPTLNASDPNFIQYNNVPMGVDRWRDKVFVTMPRRRHGIPATVNWLSLENDGDIKDPPLRPYPDYETNALREDNQQDPNKLISVYRTRVDVCDRIWMVDTGLLEIPDAPVRIQQPTIVIYDLLTDMRIRNYELAPTDTFERSLIPSITVDVTPSTCGEAYAYLPDVYGFGIVVYSFRENRSWRINHNYFLPEALGGDFDVNGLLFQWTDGVFSVSLSPPQTDGHRVAFFHPMASTYEFAVSTRVLKNETLSRRSYHGSDFMVIGNRGPKSQSCMHAMDPVNGVLFFSEVGRNGLGCWNTQKPFSLDNYVQLAQDDVRFIYPSDVKVDNENTLWVIANSMTFFIYTSIDPNIVNFYIYRANVNELVKNTACSMQRKPNRPYSYAG